MSVQTLKQTNSPRAGAQVGAYRELLARYLGGQKGRVAWMAFLLLAGIGLQLANPQIIRYVLDTAQAGGALRSLTVAALVFIGFALAQQAMGLAAAYTSQMVGWTATNRLRADLTLHCLRLDMGFHKRHTPGEMVERIDGDVTLLANFFSTLVVEVLGSGLLVVGILAMLAREDARVGLGMALYSALTLAVLGSIQKLAVSRWAAARQARAEQNGYLEERISGAEEVRALGAEAHALRRFYRLLRSAFVKDRAAFVAGSLAYSLTNLIYVVGFTIGLGLGVYLYTQGQATLGAAYLIVHYVGMLADPLQNIRRQVQDLQQATAGIQRIQELFALQPAVRDGAPVGATPFAGNPAAAPVEEVRIADKSTAVDGETLPPGALGVAFEAVTFHYDDEAYAPAGEAAEPGSSNGSVLEDVTFRLAAGRVLGILGRTGSGKTTLTRLLFRLYDPDRGAIRLAGRPLPGLALEALRRRVGLVTQDVQIFQASVRDNLTLFDRAIPDARLWAILGELGLAEWARGLPAGLDTRLGADGGGAAGPGVGLSAGEAQLLAFARVFLKDPGLVVLDEASSRLDPATEARMERAIDRLFSGRTGIVIAHRLKTVQRADEILILEGGRVVEFGPRATLAADPRSRFAHLLRTGLEEVMA